MDFESYEILRFSLKNANVKIKIGTIVALN